jgi:hypothetical protein
MRYPLRDYSGLNELTRGAKIEPHPTRVKLVNESALARV